MLDFHTHNLEALPGSAIINLPLEVLEQPETFKWKTGGTYSVGIHPYWTADETKISGFIEHFHLLAAHPQVVAIGECGFDRLRGNLSLQEKIFPLQIETAEQLRLPVILHCVRAFDLLLKWKKQLRPTTQWTVHGFRGKPALAQQLLDAGLDLSFGKHYGEDSFRLTPPSRRHRETDEDF